MIIFIHHKHGNVGLKLAHNLHCLSKIFLNFFLFDYIISVSFPYSACCVCVWRILSVMIMATRNGEQSVIQLLIGDKIYTLCLNTA